ncbi:MAG: thiopurine S-methyltransferase [Salinimicrobium sediminis]|nr:thiopurine S-methyltransferase [Salinimicrobium sediminis]
MTPKKTMQEFWNERYQREEYIYGKDPNEYLKAKLKNLTPGRILFPAEGEGRNAVHAAKKAGRYQLLIKVRKAGRKL